MNKALLVATFALGSSACSLNLLAQEVSVNKPTRPVVRDERPDEARGWVIASQATYWPLAYEALDRLEELRVKSESSESDAIVESLGKSSAWLGMAASASMIRNEAKIHSVIAEMEELSEQIDKGNGVPSSDTLQKLATMGELSIARSHLVRAMNEFSEPAPEPKLRAKLAKSKPLQAEEAGIARDRIERHIAQYRYDLAQAQRHVTVARVYLEMAAKGDSFEVTEMTTEAIEPLRGDEKHHDLVHIAEDLVRDAQQLVDFIEKKQAELAKRLN